MVIQPFRVAVDSVAGDARRILYYGDALADYLIEEGGFSGGLLPPQVALTYYITSLDCICK